MFTSNTCRLCVCVCLHVRDTLSHSVCVSVVILFAVFVWMAESSLVAEWVVDELTSRSRSLYCVVISKSSRRRHLSLSLVSRVAMAFSVRENVV